MTRVKVVKNRAYYKRYQTKFRRRREGKTDYAARRRMIFQMKTKYDSPKYRLVVRFTKKDVICQIVSSKIVGDEVLAAAYSHELPRYGIVVGLTNYASAYATGLLLARRVLKKLKLDKQYVGNTENIGEDYNVEMIGGNRPFKCILDVGLRRTTTGSKLFAAMKGVCDGGVDVPHSKNRFVGHGKKYEDLDTEVFRQHLFGIHVANYMRLMKESDEEKYKKHFAQYIKNGIEADKIEQMYTEAHKKIRENPDPAPKKEYKKKEESSKDVEKKDGQPVEKRKRFRQEKLSLKERKANLEQKKARLAAKASA